MQRKRTPSSLNLNLAKLQRTSDKKIVKNLLIQRNFDSLLLIRVSRTQTYLRDTRKYRCIRSYFIVICECVPFASTAWANKIASIYDAYVRFLVHRCFAALIEFHSFYSFFAFVSIVQTNCVCARASAPRATKSAQTMTSFTLACPMVLPWQ